MKEIFLTGQLPLELNKIGFDEPCIATVDYQGRELKMTFNHRDGGVRNSEIKYGFTAPTPQQIIDWFRKNHDIIITAKLCSYSVRWYRLLKNPNFKFQAFVFTFKDGEQTYGEFEDYNIALNTAIVQAIKFCNTLPPINKSL